MAVALTQDIAQHSMRYVIGKQYLSSNFCITPWLSLGNLVCVEQTRAVFARKNLFQSRLPQIVDNKLYLRPAGPTCFQAKEWKSIHFGLDIDLGKNIGADPSSAHNQLELLQGLTFHEDQIIQVTDQTQFVFLMRNKTDSTIHVSDDTPVVVLE